VTCLPLLIFSSTTSRWHHRVSKEHKYHKKREEKLKDLLRRAAKDKRESCSQLEIMQQEISVALAELQIAGDRIKSLEFEIEDITSRRKRDVHECCPDTSATFELERLRNKNEALEGSLSEARRDAREARESLGRETAASDLVAKQLETSHSRLLQAQTAMSECLEETAKLTRQLEDERAKSAALRRRAEGTPVDIFSVLNFPLLKVTFRTLFFGSCGGERKGGC
jgi:uncharacterized coiled-coil DUF342 family protein